MQIWYHTYLVHFCHIVFQSSVYNVTRRRKIHSSCSSSENSVWRKSRDAGSEVCLRPLTRRALEIRSAAETRRPSDNKMITREYTGNYRNDNDEENDDNNGDINERDREREREWRMREGRTRTFRTNPPGGGGGGEWERKEKEEQEQEKGENDQLR